MKFSYNIELKSQSKRLCLLVDDSIDIVSTTYLLEIIVHAMNVFNIIDAYVKKYLQGLCQLDHENLVLVLNIFSNVSLSIKSSFILRLY